MQNEKNLSKETGYYIGVDIGTDSVGYAVTDKSYLPCKYKGDPMLGVTLFDAANLCADRRSHRTARRRLDRRQERVDLVQTLFAEEIAKVDPHFFLRMKESALWECDKSQETLCGCDWEDKAYHKAFPTIHHLIVRLMDTAEGLDIRYLYLAIAWLVAHRGHFLIEMDGERVEELTDVTPLYAEFMQWFDDNGYARPWECDAAAFGAILARKCGVRGKEVALTECLFGEKKKALEPEECPLYVAGLLRLFAGGTVDVKKLFKAEGYGETEEKLCLSDPDKLEEILPELGEDAEIIVLAARIYDCAKLTLLLDGKSFISEVKVAQYQQHQADLKRLKCLIRKYCPAEYSKMFRDAAAGAYSGYVANFKASSEKEKQKRVKKEDFYKYVKKVLEKITPEEADAPTLADIFARMEIGTYMPKQVDGDNRLIPQQLYYAELKRILQNCAGAFPFLEQRDADGFSVADKLKSIFHFRIPYYVGPLNKHSEHAWLERKAGKILPWNFDAMVDHDASEEAFIRRMTNKCTYLPGEDVLPKNSLVYSKFTILNLLNNLCIDGRSIPVQVKQDLFETLCMRKKKVTHRGIVDYLISIGAISKGEEERISGIDKGVAFSYRSYLDFARLLSTGILTEANVEQVILRLTCTEEKTRFKRWLENYAKEQGKPLSPEDVKYIASKKYSDFGRLSAKLLNGMEGTSTETGETGTVMYFLWNTNDNLMQLLSDKYTFTQQITMAQKEYFSQHPMDLNQRLENMGLSNAVKRPVIRTLDIIQDIVKVKKRPPEKVFVEMARGTKEDQRGKRTDSRKDKLLEWYKSMDDDEVAEMRRQLEMLGEDANQRLQSEALFLYFVQLGRCMYCGKPLDISLLGGGEYDIDHIYPQAYVKDDSIHNNKVLVHKSENGSKSDTYPLPSAWRERMYGHWKHLRDCRLINEEKFKRLTRATPFTADEKQGFINRQLVETRQSTKAVTELLQERYPETEIVFVKAGAVSDFRHEYGEIKDHAFRLHLTDAQKKELCFVKSRTANDIHHAQDAYLNIVVGNLFHEKFSCRFFSITEESYSLNFHTLFGRRYERDPSVWDPQEHLPNVEKAMTNPHIHLTKYQYCQKGGFYDQNPLKAGTGSLVPFRNGMAVERYGGYNKPTVSFYVLVRYRCGKKMELTLLPCELLAAERMQQDAAFAEAYICSKLPEKATDITRPLGDRILKVNTVFSLDGFEVCLAGKSGDKVVVRSLTSPRYPDRWMRYIKKIENVAKKQADKGGYHIQERYDGISAAQNLELFDWLVGMMNGPVFSKMPGARPCVREGKRETFECLTVEEQLKCLENMILYLKTNRAGGCDMKEVRGTAHEGIIRLSVNLSNWKKNYTDVRIVDRSASGLFEKRSDNLLSLL